MTTKTQYTIDTNQLVESAKEANMTPEIFKEAVIERTGQMINDQRTGGNSSPHEVEAVEISAQRLSQWALRKVSSEIAQGFGTSMDQLKKLVFDNYVATA